MAENKNLYPTLVIKNNPNPNRLLAFPLLGILIKIILLIPVLIEAFFLAFAGLALFLITPFVILFTGKYWEAAYDFFLGYFKFNTKIKLYLYGITDKYPGFGLDDNGVFTLKIDKPKSPSRAMAFPILGFIARLILQIPYRLFGAILSYGEVIAVLFSWFTVLFTGKYPESLYEFISDATRINLASQIYMFYLSDSYPSFAMKIKNQTVKILLIIAGTLLILSRFGNAINEAKKSKDDRFQNNKYNYPNQKYNYPDK
ncbi:MAG TPA: DUF4389 domain-containing protein [Candidatus Saccharimonadales bacterium]|nr:DUF4389 domain-containing protein [Candidatus Saccharimonadales bacterium]